MECVWYVVESHVAMCTRVLVDDDYKYPHVRYQCCMCVHSDAVNVPYICSLKHLVSSNSQLEMEARKISS